MNYVKALRTALVDSTTLDTPRVRALVDEQIAVPPCDDAAHREVRQQRAARLRVLAGSFLGVVLLFVAQRLLPLGGAPFAHPDGWTAWLAAACGMAGIWLVPGVWLSAVMMRTGAAPIAWLTTRIGVLLAWYAQVGIVVHYSGQGARPTAGSIIGMTAAATAASCLGVALGMLSRPVNRRARILASAVAGGTCAQIVIWLAMRYWTYQINYEHISRLDWVIVLACALLAALGQASRPTLPVWDAVRIRCALVALAAITATAAITAAAAVTWPTTQRLPSALAAEQVSAFAGADLALALAGTGPQGFEVLGGVSFTAVDDLGRPLSAHFRITNESGAKDRATLLVFLDPVNRPVLCGATDISGQAVPVKVTVRDLSSGMYTQAVLPAGWCAK